MYSRFYKIIENNEYAKVRMFLMTILSPVLDVVEFYRLFYILSCYKKVWEERQCNLNTHRLSVQYKFILFSDCTIQSSDDGSSKHVENGDSNQNP